MKKQTSIQTEEGTNYKVKHITKIDPDYRSASHFIEVATLRLIKIWERANGTIKLENK